MNNGLSFDNSISVVVDLETESQQPNSGIISIGLAKIILDPIDTNIQDTKYIEVDPSTNSPLTHMQYDTQEWWKGFNKPRGITSIRGALQQVNAFCEGIDYLWGHGTEFDNLVLYQNMLMHCVQPTSVIANYWRWSHTRTYYRAHGFNYSSFRKQHRLVDQKHNALADAIMEAEGLIETYKLNKGMK